MICLENHWCFIHFCIISKHPSFIHSLMPSTNGCGGGVLVYKLCPTPCNPMDYSPPGSSLCGICQGCHFLLQGIFPTQGLNLVSCTGRQILNHGATGSTNGSHAPTVSRTLSPVLETADCVLADLRPTAQVLRPVTCAKGLPQPLSFVPSSLGRPCYNAPGQTLLLWWTSFHKSLVLFALCVLGKNAPSCHMGLSLSIGWCFCVLSR